MVKLLYLLEVAFVLLALVGVALVHVPTALVLGGLLGVLAVERALNVGRKEAGS